MQTEKSRHVRQTLDHQWTTSLFFGPVVCLFFAACSSAPQKPATLDDIIRREVSHHLEEHEACFEDYQKRRPNIFGDLALQWTITPTGETTDVSVREDQSNLHDKELRRCMVESIKKVKFPAHPSRAIFVAAYPFHFRK